jgi:hypothetical protein
MNWESLWIFVSSHQKTQTWDQWHFKLRWHDDLFFRIDCWIKSLHQTRHFRWSTYQILYIWWSAWNVFNIINAIFLCVFCRSCSARVQLSFWFFIFSIFIICCYCLDSCIWICDNQSINSYWESTCSFRLFICICFESTCSFCIIICDLCISLSKFDVNRWKLLWIDTISTRTKFLQEIVAIKQDL